MNIVEHKCWMFGSGNSKYFIKYNKLCMSKCDERQVCVERASAKRGQVQREGKCKERARAKRGQVRREGKCEERTSAKRGQVRREQVTREGKCEERTSAKRGQVYIGECHLSNINLLK